MAYIKNDWVTGDVITADKLNHIEDGIGQIDFDQSEMDERLSSEIAALDEKVHAYVIDHGVSDNFTLYPPTSETVPSSRTTGRVEYTLPDNLKDDWKIGGVVKYEIKNGNNRINAMPVFMFTMDSQTAIRIGFVSPSPVATKIDLAILLVRR